MQDDEPTTLAITSALVNVLMETHAAGATDHQIIQCAFSAAVSVVINLRAERDVLGMLPQIQQSLYQKWQERMIDEGEGQVRH